MNPDLPTQYLKIERPLYDQEGLQQALEYEKPSAKLLSKLKCKCKPSSFFLDTIPVLRWLPRYKWREDLVNDLVSGFTVAVMHIPQGMAYALLGNVPPVVGIYMAFFPVLVYFFLGTSKHNSMGIYLLWVLGAFSCTLVAADSSICVPNRNTPIQVHNYYSYVYILIQKFISRTFAIVCLMTGKVVLEKSESEATFISSLKSNLTDTGDPIVGHTPIEIATSVTFIVAIFQLLMYIFRLGIVSTLLSETLVNGFTTGSAVHVLASQIKDLLGVQIPNHKGAFTVINIFVSIFQELPNTNMVAAIISVVTITVCVINNEVLKPRMSKISSFPIPIELLVVVTGTLVSNHWNFTDTYDVKIIGNVPSGIPPPTLPDFNLAGSVIVDGLIIAIVAYTISLSMGMIFAQKLNYEVDANQELLAQGAGNLFGSFFSCMPFSASLSRSLIQQTVGGKTQLASIVSCFILLFVLLWIGPFFEPLPKAVLASVIVVALKGMLVQVASLKKFWNLSKLDGAVWFITFATTVIVNVDIGLLVGVIVSLLSVMILGMKPYTCLLGSVPCTDLYVDIRRYKKAIEIPHIKIFHYCGGINFATRNHFKTEVYKLVGVDPQKEYAYRMKQLKNSKSDKEGVDNMAFENATVYTLDDKVPDAKTNQLQYVIIDFSALSYIDPSSVTTMKAVAEDFQKINVSVFIAGCSGPVYEMLQKCDLLKNIDLLKIFPTVHDAVQCIQTSVDVTPF